MTGATLVVAPFKGRRRPTEVMETIGGTVSDIRRIVTGHDSEGKAIIVSDGAPPRVVDLSGRGTRFHEVWRTTESPARIERARAEPPDERLTLAPPKNGVRIRVVDFP